jgi:hypothetical protein
MTVSYIAAPFHPWWDESKTGPAPNCERCGAVMVRVGEPGCEAAQRRYGLGGLIPGWRCMSCKNCKWDRDKKGAK